MGDEKSVLTSLNAKSHELIPIIGIVNIFKMQHSWP